MLLYAQALISPLNALQSPVWPGFFLFADPFLIRSNFRHNTAQQPVSRLTLKGVQSPKSMWWLWWLQAVSHLSGFWKWLYLTEKKKKISISLLCISLHHWRSFNYNVNLWTWFKWFKSFFFADLNHQWSCSYHHVSLSSPAYCGTIWLF